MKGLFYHPNTQIVLDGLADNPKQSILLLGEKGSGKHTTALNLIARLLGVKTSNLEKSPYLLVISGSDKPITIESIRDIRNFIKLKVPGKNGSINRAILIENASNMSLEAQNSLLKMIEEPPEKTAFILTAENENGLLDTVVSRVVKVGILPVSKALAQSYFGDKYSEEDISKAYSISGGRVGLMYSILSDSNHPLLDDINLAKQILSEKPASRLLKTDEMSKNKDNIKNLIAALQNISHAAMHQASINKNLESVKQWHKRLEISQKAEVLLLKNANTKLLLDDLFIGL